MLRIDLMEFFLGKILLIVTCRHKGKKVIKCNFFLWGEGGLCLLKFLAQNGLKMRFFKFCGKSVDWTLLIFCMKLQRHNGLKSTHLFLDKFWTWVFRQKRVQNECLWVFNQVNALIFSRTLHDVIAAKKLKFG